MREKWNWLAKEIKNIHGNTGIVPLHEPIFDEKEIEYVTNCIRTGWVSSVGSYVDTFEKKLAEYTGVKRAVAVVNGTAALHIAMKIVGIKANEEVFMPALTFVATANAAVYLQAIPHFVDVSEETLGVDPIKLEDYIKEIGIIKSGNLVNKQTGRIIRAIVPMHTFGHPVDLDPLIEVCDRYNLILVEDAAESLGSFYKGKHTGSFGAASAISFNGNKIITTGGGGAILTNDDKLADYAKHITTQAKVPHQWEYVHDDIGYNYRMPNINAALGCAQLEKIESLLDAKRNLTNKYQRLFDKLEEVELYIGPPFAESNYWLQTLIIKSKQYNRNEILLNLNNLGIISRPVWTPLYDLDPFKNCPQSDLSVTIYLKETLINIPSTAFQGETYQ